MADKLTPRKLLKMVQKALDVNKEVVSNMIDDKIAALKPLSDSKSELIKTPPRQIKIVPADFRLEFTVGGNGDPNDPQRKAEFEDLAHRVCGLMIDKKVNKLIIHLLKKF
jgi:hypothetical protein